MVCRKVRSLLSLNSLNLFSSFFKEQMIGPGVGNMKKKHRKGWETLTMLHERRWFGKGCAAWDERKGWRSSAETFSLRKMYACNHCKVLTPVAFWHFPDCPFRITSHTFTLSFERHPYPERLTYMGTYLYKWAVQGWGPMLKGNLAVLGLDLMTFQSRAQQLNHWATTTIGQFI